MKFGSRACPCCLIQIQTLNQKLEASCSLAFVDPIDRSMKIMGSDKRLIRHLGTNTALEPGGNEEQLNSRSDATLNYIILKVSLMRHLLVQRKCGNRICWYLVGFKFRREVLKQYSCYVKLHR